MTLDKTGNEWKVPRVSLFIGTRAQLIKMIPVGWELERRCIPHRLINTGQHESTFTDLREQYGIRPPEHSLGNKRRDVNTLGRGVQWIAGNLARYTLSGTWTKRELFDGTEGIVLVHGDTASTLLSTLIARRAGQRVMHIEAGLRSWNLLHPFPEELVRLAVMKLSDYLVAPSAQAHDNLSRMSIKGRVWRVAGNTGQDIVAADLRKTQGRAAEMEGPYCVATIHRMETLYSRSRLRQVVDTILAAQRRVSVLFVQHAPTAQRLAAYGMSDALDGAGVRQLPLMDHTGFVHLLKAAQFIITDGGSVQEEAGYLGVPCLVMRVATERGDGLGENVVLSGMDKGRIESFIDNYEQHRRPPIDFEKLSPSAEIVDILLSKLGDTAGARDRVREPPLT